MTTILSTIDNWPDAAVHIAGYAFLAFVACHILK